MAIDIGNRPVPLLIHFVILCVFGACVSAFGQEPNQTSTEAVLIDEFGRAGDCEFSARIDTFFAELSNNPEHRGYIINYKPADELPGDRNNFLRDRTITNHIAFRNFDASRITLLRGGYRQEMSTELWLVPPGAKPPEPSRTLAAPETPERSTFLYAKKYLYSDYDENILQEFVLQSIKDQEEADRLALEAESKEEAEAASEADPETEATAGAESETELTDAAEDPAPFVDERTAEEKEDERFSWAAVGIARLLAERKTGTGLIIFYADDQRYDIGRLTAFIEQGRDRLAQSGAVKAERLRVEFGGYRHEPQVEFWVVPPKGKTPKATPDGRPVEEPDANQD